MSEEPAPAANSQPQPNTPEPPPPADTRAVDPTVDAAAPETVPASPPEIPADGAALLEGMPDQAAIDELLKQASFEDPTGASVGTSAAHPADVGAGHDATEGTPFDLPSFQQVMADAQVSSIDLLRDVELNVKIELGRSRMLVEDVLKLAEGSVVELDKLAGDPVDVFVNDRLVARGEVLVLNENFCVRVNEIVAGLKEEGV